MRILSTILMVLMLFLVGQPVCSASSSQHAATESCCGSGEPGCAGEEAPGEEDGHQDDCKGCNPFQSCSCCAAGVLAGPVSIFTEGGRPAVWTRQLLGTAPEKLLSVDLFGFWQPPRAA